MTYDPNAATVGNQQQWTVDGWDGYWASKTGGETTGETTTAYDGGEKTPEVLAGNKQTSNLILTRLYRPGPHAAKAREWESKVLSLRTTVTGYDTDPDLGPVGEPLAYNDALLVRVKRPDYDASSSSPQYLELEFATSGPAI